MAHKRKLVTLDVSDDESLPKRRRTNGTYKNHIDMFDSGSDSSSDLDDDLSQEKSYNSELDYPDEQSRSRSHSRSSSRDRDDSESERTVLELDEDPDLPSPDPRIAATRPRPHRVPLNNNAARPFRPPRAVNDGVSELIHIDDEGDSDLFSPRSARVARQLQQEESTARRKREDDERKSEQLVHQLLQEELELNRFHRDPVPSADTPAEALTDEQLARMLQEQENQHAFGQRTPRYASFLGSSSPPFALPNSRRMFGAPMHVSPVHEDYDYGHVSLTHSSPSPLGRRGHFHQRHHHHSHHGHGHGSPMSYESLVNLEPVKVAAKNIHLLPVSVYNKENVKNSAQSPCSICLDDFETGDKVKTLPCFHAFHVKCVDKWLKMNHLCPVCKKEVDTE